MKKKIVVTLFFISALISLAGCNKKPDARKAVEAFVNTEFYLKDFDNYEKAFGKKVDKTSGDLVKEDLGQQFEAMGVKASDSQKVVEAVVDALINKTKYTAKTIEEETDNARVEVVVTGIDISKFQEDIQQLSQDNLIKAVKASGIKDIETIEDLSQLKSEADVAKATEVTENYMNNSDNVTNIILEAIKKMEPAKTDNKVNIELIPSEGNKKYWSIKNETEMINQITSSMME